MILEVSTQRLLTELRAQRLWEQDPRQSPRASVNDWDAVWVLAWGQMLIVSNAAEYTGEHRGYWVTSVKARELLAMLGLIGL